jgi:hypothetical protein
VCVWDGVVEEFILEVEGVSDLVLGLDGYGGENVGDVV